MSKEKEFKCKSKQIFVWMSVNHFRNEESFFIKCDYSKVDKRGHNLHVGYRKYTKVFLYNKTIGIKMYMLFKINEVF
jgi:hypothetical protein